MFGITPSRKRERQNGGIAPRQSGYPIARLRHELDNMFNEFFQSLPGIFEREGVADQFWGFDMEDAGKEIVVRAEAPGFEAKDFDIQISGNLLTIHAEHKTETQDKGAERPTSEKHFVRLQRSITLPAGIDPDKIEAKYHNGVLEVHVPKTPEAQGKRIEIK